MYRSATAETTFFDIVLEQAGMLDSIIVRCVHKGEASMSWEFCLDPGMDLYRIMDVVREAVETFEAIDYAEYSFSNPEMTSARMNMTAMLGVVIEDVQRWVCDDIQKDVV